MKAITNLNHTIMLDMIYSIENPASRRECMHTHDFNLIFIKTE